MRGWSAFLHKLKGQAAIEHFGTVAMFLVLVIPLAILAIVNAMTFSESSANYVTYINLLKLKALIQKALVFCPSELTAVIYLPRTTNLSLVMLERDGIALYMLSAVGKYGSQNIAVQILNEKPVNIRMNITPPFETLPVKIVCKDEVGYYAVEIQRANIG